MELRDELVVLRPWRVADAAGVEAACNDAEAVRWLPALPIPYTRDHALEYIRGCLAAGDERHAFAIADAATDELLGSIDVDVRRWHTGHIGYWVAPGARGRGVCTRALKLLSRWILGDRGLVRAELITDSDNLASQRVAEKAGYTREGRLRSAIEYQDGRRADAIMFSLLAGEPD